MAGPHRRFQGTGAILASCLSCMLCIRSGMNMNSDSNPSLLGIDAGKTLHLQSFVELSSNISKKVVSQRDIAYGCDLSWFPFMRMPRVLTDPSASLNSSTQKQPAVPRIYRSAQNWGRAVSDNRNNSRGCRSWGEFEVAWKMCAISSLYDTDYFWPGATRNGEIHHRPL